MYPFHNTTRVSFLWEIREFNTYLEVHQKELESPPFFVKCSEVIGFFLVLRLRDHILDIALCRLDRFDDLHDLQLLYKISVVGKDNTLHFTTQYSTYLANDTRSVKALDFLDTNQLTDEHVYDLTLRLQVDLDIYIQNEITRRWNFSHDLFKLSVDMINLYKTGVGSDRRIQLNNTCFRVHSLIVSARCPEFKEHFYPEDRIMSTPPDSPTRGVIFARLQEYVRRLGLPPKSRVLERSRKLASSTREERFLKVFNVLLCDSFLIYLYSGQYEMPAHAIPKIDDDRKLQLLIVARRYNLMDLVRKLQSAETKSTAVTELVTDAVTLDFDLSFLRERNADSFMPCTRLINLSNTGKKYLQVTFTIVDSPTGDQIRVFFKLLEVPLPVILKAEIEVLHVGSRNSSKTSSELIKNFNQPDGGRSATMFVPFVRQMRLRCRFTVYNIDSSRMLRREFVVPSTLFAGSQSLRQLRNDLAAVLVGRDSSSDESSDLSLIVDGKKLQVHRLIVNARAPGLKLEPVTSQVLQGVDVHNMVNVVEYMYTAILFETETENLAKMRDVADQFRMPQLSLTCRSFLGV